MSFLAKLWGCFFGWSVETSRDLSSAQAIIAQSFGLRARGEPGLSNRILGLAVKAIYRDHQLPVILQWEVAQYASGVPAIGIIRKHRIEGEYLDTYEVLAQTAEICKKNGWGRVIVIAHPHHMWRVAQTAEKFGLEPLIPQLPPVPYDSESIQLWTRSPFLFIPREVLYRLYLLFRGQI